MRLPTVTAALIVAIGPLGALLAIAGGNGQGTIATTERPLAERICSRDFPSVFQAWSPADNVPGESKQAMLCRHDLIWAGPGFFGLDWNNRHRGLADGFTGGSIAKGMALRRTLLDLNPNMVLIAEIRYRDANRSYLPEGHKWWLRNKKGQIVPGWDEGGFLCLDFHNPEFRSQVVKQAKAAVDSGVVDGVMLDWWSDDPSRLALVREVRRAIGEKAIIIANASYRKTPLTAPYINGYFMECYRSKTAKDWQQIADTLAWAETNLREPKVNCLETWYHKSRDDLNLMRATTTLALTHSDGYCLFSDPNTLPTPDHRHNWYPFWNKSLGKPTGKARKNPDGTVSRDFEKGTAVYNPMGNKPVSVTFLEERTSLATGKAAGSHQLGSPDGDIFLKVGHRP